MIRPPWFRLSPASLYPRQGLASRGLTLFGQESCCVWCWSGSLLAVLLLMAACTTAPPRNVNDACAIFAEYDDWYPAAQTASQRWGVPVSVILAIIYYESSFRADAQPPRKWYLGFIPGSRPSSAYGYSQALDGTWERYIAATGNRGADRDDFDDAVDFIGWYVNETAKRNRISKSDAYRQYLAYHEGQEGFAKGSYRQKPWLIKRARQVGQQAERYRAQLARCKPQVDESFPTSSALSNSSDSFLGDGG